MQNTSILEKEGTCSDDQIKADFLNNTFPDLVPSVQLEELGGTVTDGDVLTGFELFHAVVYCPSDRGIMGRNKFYRFVEQFVLDKN